MYAEPFSCDDIAYYALLQNVLRDLKSDTLGKTPMDGGPFACDYITPKMLSSVPCKRNFNLIMFHFKHLCMMATLPAAGAPATQPTPMNTVA